MNKSTANNITKSREITEFKERILPGNKTLRCPVCDNAHALWYRMGVKDRKSLVFTCDKVKHYWYTDPPTGSDKPVEHWKHVTKTFEAPVFIDGLPIYVDWTPQKRAEFQKKHQHQLPIMVNPKS